MAPDLVELYESSSLRVPRPIRVKQPFPLLRTPDPEAYLAWANPDRGPLPQYMLETVAREPRAANALEISERGVQSNMPGDSLLPQVPLVDVGADHSLSEWMCCPFEVSNLREFSESRQRIGTPLVDRPASAGKVPPPLEKIDLLGGNGTWRQKRAEVEFECRRVQEEERLQHEKLDQEERRRLRAKFEERKRRLKLEDDQRRREEQERLRRQDEERRYQRLLDEEEARLRREEEERLRLAKLPKPCFACNASGSCLGCGGKGQVPSLYLAPKVEVQLSHRLDYGRSFQGCESCGGTFKGMIGNIERGSGCCSACGGVGEIPPVVEQDEPAVERTKTMPRFVF